MSILQLITKNEKKKISLSIKETVLPIYQVAIHWFSGVILFYKKNLGMMLIDYFQKDTDCGSYVSSKNVSPQET